MNHNDASKSSIRDLSNQAANSAAAQSSDRMEQLPVKRAEPVHSPLAVTQNFEARQVSVEDAQTLSSPILDSFLPKTNRLLMLGSIGLVGALGLGAVALTVLPYRTTINAIATVEPVDATQPIQSDIGGIVENIFVQDYEIVENDQVIASLDNPSLNKEVANIKSQIDQLQNQIFQIENELIVLRQRRSRAIPDKQFQYSERLLVDHLRDLNNQLTQRRNKFEKVQQQIDRMTVRAPVAGTLYRLELHTLGQPVEANETIAKLLPRDAALEIHTLIPREDINDVEVGDSTRIRLNHCSSLSSIGLKGSISAVESVELTPGKEKYKVTVDAAPGEEQLEANQCQLLPGTEGEITIIAKQEKLLNFFLRKLRFNTNV